MREDAAPSPRELIEKAREALQATGPTDFARKLGYGPEGYQKVYRWSKAAEPSIQYEDAWLLLSALGWIRREPLGMDLVEAAVRRLDAGEPVPARERERVAKLADRLSRDLLRLADRLREGARGARK